MEREKGVRKVCAARCVLLRKEVRSACIASERVGLQQRLAADLQPNKSVQASRRSFIHFRRACFGEKILELHRGIQENVSRLGLAQSGQTRDVPRKCVLGHACIAHFRKETKNGMRRAAGLARFRS